MSHKRTTGAGVPSYAVVNPSGRGPADAERPDFGPCPSLSQTLHEASLFSLVLLR